MAWEWLYVWPSAQTHKLRVPVLTRKSLDLAQALVASVSVCWKHTEVLGRMVGDVIRQSVYLLCCLPVYRS